MSWLCERYGVTRGGYYAWRSRERSDHARSDETLSERIVAIFNASAGTYGAPRIHAALAQAGIGVGRKRVARLMRQGNLKARSATLYRRTPGTKRFFDAIPNRVLGTETDALDQNLGRRRHLPQGRRIMALPGRGDGSPLATDPATCSCFPVRRCGRHLRCRCLLLDLFLHLVDSLRYRRRPDVLRWRSDEDTR